MNLKRSKKAVTELLGTFILLMISIALFTLVNFVVITYPFAGSIPSVNLVGAINFNNPIVTTDDTIVLKHNYGDPLPSNTKIIIIIDDNSYDKPVDYFLGPSEIWNIGEIIEINPNSIFGFSGDLASSYVKVTVIDEASNTVIMMAEL